MKRMKKMKKISYTVPSIAFSIIYTLAGLSLFVALALILKTVATEFPEFWEFLDKDNLMEGGIVMGIIRLIVCFAITAIVCGIAFIIYKTSTIVVSRIIGHDLSITCSGNKYPKRYYISRSPYTDDDRRQSVQDAWGYYRAYTVVIEFTHKEITQIVSYMNLNNTEYYELPKSFLMPDNVSWLHPKVSRRTIRRIIKELPSNGAVLLEYKCTYPKKSQIVHIPTKMRIKANLHCPTYTSKDVFIGLDDLNS